MNGLKAFFKSLIQAWKQTKEIKKAEKQTSFLVRAGQHGKTWAFAYDWAFQVAVKGKETMLFKATSHESLLCWLVGFKTAMLEIYGLKEKTGYTLEIEKKENSWIITTKTLMRSK